MAWLESVGGRWPLALAGRSRQRILALMTHDEAMEFLKAHQPLPGDRQMNQTTIDRFDEVRRHFIDHPALEALPLLLGALGRANVESTL
jgi:hypothetical protein